MHLGAARFSTWCQGIVRKRPWAVTGALLGLLLVGGWALAWWLTWPDIGALHAAPPASTAFIDAYRAGRRAAGAPDRVAWTWVPWSRISVNLKRAVVCAEDLEFFSHHGFSTAELEAAVRDALVEGRAPRGASTITQQLAKNLWLSPSRNPLRKLKEALLTRGLERRLSKRRILELYLNVAEFGTGVYGAEAAAQRYFGKPASALTERESAELAASLPRPGSWHPGQTSRGYQAYVADIQGRMSRAAFLWRRLGESPRPAPLDSLVVPRDTVP